MPNSQPVNPTLVRVLLLLGLAVLYIVGLNFFIGQIFQVNGRIAQERQTMTALNQKVAALSSTGNITDFTDDVVIALPQVESSILGISQIKAAAANAGVSVDNVSYSAGSQVGQDVNRINFGVDVSGNTIGFKNFLINIRNSAPVSTISNLRLSQLSTTGQLSVSLSYYWGPLPAQLPELEKPIGNLSEADVALISQLANLSKPSLNLLPDGGSETIDQNRSNIFEITN